MSKENLTSLSDFLKNRFNKNYLFYDAELESILKQLDNIFSIVKRVKKRFTRRETLRISPSMCQYVQLLDEVENAPYMLYRFTDRNMVICITRYKNLYYVFVDGHSNDVRTYFSFYQKDNNLFGGYARLDECIVLFHNIVGVYLKDIVNGLFKTLVFSED